MSGCNCPSMDDVMRLGVGTKSPCPIHDTPEVLARLAAILVPAIPAGPISVAPVGGERPTGGAS